MRRHPSGYSHPRLGILLGLLCLLGTACGPAPTAEPPATLQPVQVAYRPAAQPALLRLEACAAGEPSIALYAQPDVRPLAEIEADIILTLGEDGVSETSYSATLLSEETLAVIVNINNPLARMTGQDLQAIYSGESTIWQTNRPNSEIQAWTYAAQEGPRRVFESAVYGAEVSNSGGIFLAANPQAMLDAIASNANAIGYLPATWLLPGTGEQVELIHAIQLDGPIANQMALPILALTPSEPGNLIQTLLLCAQREE